MPFAWCFCRSGARKNPVRFCLVSVGRARVSFPAGKRAVVGRRICSLAWMYGSMRWGDDMQPVLAGISAFRFHRIPPQVLGLLPPVSQERDYGRGKLYGHPLVTESLGLPLVCLTDERRTRTGAANISWALVRGEMPFGSVLESELGVSVTSPAMTLLTLARRLSLTRLVMAVYEMVGYFSIYAPSKAMESLLASGPLAGFGAWRRVVDAKGGASDLWQRMPLVDTGSLAGFCRQESNLYGAKKLAKAVGLVNGAVASPLEARLTAMLTLPRRMGGCALKGLANNKAVRLDASQSSVAGQGVCHVDLYHEGAERGRPLAIECQGLLVHGSAQKLLADADRALALQRAGCEVLQVTHKQIKDPDGYRELTRLIADRTGQRLPHRDAAFVRAENSLRYELLSDWESMFD